MGDFALGLFLNLPTPTIVICKCKRVIAANLAIQHLLGRSGLPEGCGGWTCGTNCLQALDLEQIEFTIENHKQTWDSVLERVHDRGIRAVRDFTDMDGCEAFVRFPRAFNGRADGRTPPALERHDSPVKDSFTECKDPERNESDRPVEVVNAKVFMSPWEHNGIQHYVLSFHDAHITQNHSPSDNSLPDIKNEEQWLKRCQFAVFDNIPLLGYLLTPDGTTLYFNKLTRTLSGGVRVRKIGQQDDTQTMWTEDFSRKLSYDEIPAVMILRSRQELEPFRYGQINPHTGKRYVLKGWGSCLHDVDDGTFLGAVFFSEIMGEHHVLLEREKIERLRSFETICDTMPHFVWTADEQGYGDWFSSQWLEYTGLKSEDCVGWGWTQTLHPEDAERFTEAFKKAHEQAVNYEIEARCKRHDGVYRWMLKRGAPIKNSDGKVLLWTGTNTEIHETVMARIQARHERDQIVRAMQHAQVNVWAVSKNPRQLSMIEGSVIRNHQSVDDAASVKTPTTEKEVIDYTWGNIANGHELDQSVELVLEGKLPKAEIEVKWMDRWHKVWVIPDFSDGTMEGAPAGEIIGVVGCSIDISDEKMRSVLESDNRQLSEEKQLAKEQSQMKSKFLANMSHEIRTPVAGVIGLANLLLDSDLNDEQRDHSEAIQMSAQTLLMIVNDILDFSKVESGKLTLENIEFNLATLVTNLWKVMHYSAQQKSIDFSCILNFPDDLCLYGDPGRIRQILTNLISNAIKFTAHGEVKLIVTTVGSQMGKRIIFMVEDTGIGIKKEVLSNLFRPFQQGDSSTARLFGGSGLGLSISRSLASLMRGHIELDSQPGKGTTATFSVPMEVILPKFPPTSPSAVAPPFPEGPRCLLSQHLRPKSLQTSNSLPIPSYRRPNTSTRRTKSYNDRRGDPLNPEERKAREALRLQLSPEERARTHVLLAEDNAVNRMIAIRAIEKLGFSVSAVWNGQEALEYLAASNSHVEGEQEGQSRKKADIVLMDCQMPVMDGYRATHAIRTWSPASSQGQEADEASWHERAAMQRLPVIAMTASAIQGDREKCFDAGMSDYLSKPVEAGALEAMLVKWTLSARQRAGSVAGLNQDGGRRMTEWRGGKGVGDESGDYFGDAFYQQWI